MSKLILITGATSGFGNGLVKKLLQQGHRVIATGRNLTSRQEIFTQERSLYGDSLIERDLDVTKPEQRNAVVQLAKEMGGVEILINNAGYGLFGPLEETSEEQIREQFEVNFFAPTLLIRDLLPQLRETKGVVINLSSVLGFLGFPLASLYCASKFALEGLTESLAYELAPHDVKMILIQPGGYKTNFNNGTQWHSSNTESTSVYKSQIENYKALRDKQSRSPHYQDPEEVTDGVVFIIQEQSNQLRHTFGRDARLSRLARALLPQKWFHTMATKSFHRVLTKGTKKI